MCVKLASQLLFGPLILGVFAPPQFALAGDDRVFESPWRAYDVGDGTMPVAIDFGDVDGDGHRDALVAHELDQTTGISILRSTGDGAFLPEEIYRVVDTVGDGVLRDFDGDQDLDAFVTITGRGNYDSRFAVLINMGDGSFASPRYFGTGLGPQGMAVADFTGDGFPDVVTADVDDMISLVEHNAQMGANAGFLSPVRYSVSEDPVTVEAKDIDGDGDLDLAVGRSSTNPGDYGASILFNDGFGVFGGLTDYDQPPGTSRAGPAAHLVDVDLDGFPDLIQGGGYNSAPRTRISVRRNDGQGVFGAPMVVEGPVGTYTPWSISSGNLDDDGWPDLLVSVGDGRDDDGFVIFLSQGAGDFQEGAFHRGAKWTDDAKAEDVDGDGDLDVVTAANFSGVITVHENQGKGDFYESPVYSVTSLIRDMTEGDFDSDGDRDLVIGASDGLYTMRNRGDGTFFTPQLIGSGIHIGYLHLRDLNNDGHQDILCSPYLNSGFGFWVSLNNGAGGFFPLSAYSESGQGAGVDAFDCDNDGDLDVILPNSGSLHDALVFRNDGTGSFELAHVFDDTISQPGVAGGDLNHDGNMDLILNTFLGPATFLGRGDLTFDGPFATGEIMRPYQLADIDGDAQPDLCGLVASDFFATGAVGVMKGYADGSFGLVTSYPVSTDFEYAMDDLTIADMNGDGVCDIVTSNGPSSDVSILFSNGDGTLQHHDGHRYGVGYRASNAVVADFDGDGHFDVVAVVDSGDIAIIFGVRGGPTHVPTGSPRSLR